MRGAYIPRGSGVLVTPETAPPLPAPGLPGEPALAPEPAPRQPVEIAALRFLDPAAISREVALGYPFALEDGREIRTVTVRRLSAGEVGQIVTESGEAVELYAFYAAMTGLPAPVLRGMVDEDNDLVVDACRPFLPRIVTALFFGPTSETGDASSSSRSGP